MKNLYYLKKKSSYSTPNRAIIVFEGLQKQIVLKSEEIKGPNVNAPNKAIEGFLKSKKIVKKDNYLKTIDKRRIFFFQNKAKKRFIP